MAKKTWLSLVIPIHNEENILRENSLALCGYLKNLKGLKDFEIILVDNGSTDNSLDISNKLGKGISNIRVNSIKEKSLGSAILTGIINARFKYIMFYAIDLPFGTNVIEDSLKEIKNCDVVIGSKGHPMSKIKRDLSRKLFTRIYNLIVNILFNLDIRDTQGSLMLRKSKISKIIPKLTSKTPFLQTQILIYSKQNNHLIKEIPVELLKDRRHSRINVVKSSFNMVKDALMEFVK